MAWRDGSERRRALVLGALVLGAAATAVTGPAAKAADTCANPIVCENALPGTPPAQWQVSGAGDASIQGYATTFSVNAGQTVAFKVKTSATAYHLDILRLGYYQGDGARKVATITPSAALPQAQPDCLVEDGTGLVDCGTWEVSATWAVPGSAVSGVYLARLERDDTGGASVVPFVVRNDGHASDLLVQTSDETWQAYNTYGGNSLYSCTVACPPGDPQAYKGAAKVSYNRPFHSAEDDLGRSWLMYAEVPMIRFLEANGYDVGYASGADVDAGTVNVAAHQAFVSVGHDEYWTGAQRARVEDAAAHGTHLAFFSGNEVFWKTRFEPSIDASHAAGRTLVTYKETHYDAKVDPNSSSWTGTWADGRFSPPADGGRPQNALTGQLFQVNSGTADIQVPARFAKLRLWRNTAVAALTGSQVRTLAPGTGTLGYEWDVDADNGFRPAGAFRVSSTAVNGAEVFTDYGSNVAIGSATHTMTLYRAASGALVFGAGTVQWSWGLDSANPGNHAADPVMEQATVNLFADMGVQPATLRPGLTAAAASTDTLAPTASIASPVNNATVGDGNVITVSGTASDLGGGVVAGVEVSTDAGATWHPAVGTTAWTYKWIAHGNPQSQLRVRAVDDSGNLGVPAQKIAVTVACPCTLWGRNVAPSVADFGDPSAVELGVKFAAERYGNVVGLRFYKDAGNTGVHTGSLWTAAGQRLATATFSAETATGWQEVRFETPVAIAPGTTYVVSYFAPNGHYAATPMYFYGGMAPGPTGGATTYSPPLRAMKNTGGAVNGVFRYGAASGFPADSVNATNYWVDPLFVPSTTPEVVATAPAAGAVAVPLASKVKATFSVAVKPLTVGFTVTAGNGTVVGGLTSYDAATRTTTFAPFKALAANTTYTATVKNAVDQNNHKMLAPYSWSFTTSVPNANCTCALFPLTAAPATPDAGDTNAVELGVKFRADVDGVVSGVRFYKSAANTGVHTGSIWSGAGTLLATATFAAETASGWQTVTFSPPVPVIAGTVYVASYHTAVGHYAADGGAFASHGIDAAPLHAPSSAAAGGNGVYVYGDGGSFPTASFNATNYWVTPVFGSGARPTVTARVPAAGATKVNPNTTVTATFSVPLAPGSIVFTLASGALVPGTVTYNAATRTATFTPKSPLATSRTYTARVSATSISGMPMSAPAQWSFTTATSCVAGVCV